MDIFEGDQSSKSGAMRRHVCLEPSSKTKMTLRERKYDNQWIDGAGIALTVWLLQFILISFFVSDYVLSLPFFI